MKNTITERKNSLEDINTRSEQANEGIRKFEDRSVEIIQSEEEKEKKDEEK